MCQERNFQMSGKRAQDVRKKRLRCQRDALGERLGCKERERLAVRNERSKCQDRALDMSATSAPKMSELRVWNMGRHLRIKVRAQLLSTWQDVDFGLARILSGSCQNRENVFYLWNVNGGDAISKSTVAARCAGSGQFLLRLDCLKSAACRDKSREWFGTSKVESGLGRFL